MPLRPSGRTRILLTALCALLLALQLFLPPFVGIANNGDFPRVTGWLSIAPVNGWADNFAYFPSTYIHAPEFYWPSHAYSSQVLLAWLATRFGLDIRWMGALHALIFLIAFWLAARRLTLITGVLALLIFTDLSYTAYFNSFFTDTAALLGLLLMIAMSERPGWAFTLAALLFIFSKPQHGLFGLFPAALLWFRGPRLASAVVLCAALISPFTVPRTLKQQALCNLIFFKIAQTPADLSELGLPAEDAQFIGKNAYSPGVPGNDPAWLADLDRHSGYGAVARFYLRHPLRAVGFVWQDLVTQAWQVRPGNLSTHRREDAGKSGFRYSFWSDFRSWLFRVWPWHIVFFYAGAVWLAIRARSPLTLGVCALAIGECLLASLTDAVETYRHFFLFHAITDVLVCMGVIYLLTTRRNPLVQLEESESRGHRA